MTHLDVLGVDEERRARAGANLVTDEEYALPQARRHDSSGVGTMPKSPSPAEHLGRATRQVVITTRWVANEGHADA
jgi:hypothetical protein